MDVASNQSTRARMRNGARLMVRAGTRNETACARWTFHVERSTASGRPVADDVGFAPEFQRNFAARAECARAKARGVAQRGRPVDERAARERRPSASGEYKSSPRERTNEERPSRIVEPTRARGAVPRTRSGLCSARTKRASAMGAHLLSSNSASITSPFLPFAPPAGPAPAAGPSPPALGPPCPGPPEFL